MFDTNPIELSQLLDDVSAGNIQLPDFQRGWIWDDDRIKGLLASVLRDFPIGAIMTLDAGGDIKFKPCPIEGVCTNANPDRFLLDGQQRLTALYQAMLYDGPVNTRIHSTRKVRRRYYINILKALDPFEDREDAIVSIPEDKKSRDSGNRVNMDLSSHELEYHHHMMPTEQLRNPLSWMLKYNSHWNGDAPHPAGECEQTCVLDDGLDRNVLHYPDGGLPKLMEDFEAILQTFNSYKLPVINLKKGISKEAVCEVFEKVNTGGVPLTTFELVTASFAADADDFSLREDWKKRQERLSEQYGVLQKIGGEQFLQAIALLATSKKHRASIQQGAAGNSVPVISCKKDAVLKLELADWQEWADVAENGFYEAAEFLHDQCIFREGDVPYSGQIVPLAALFAEMGGELTPASAKDKLERWFWSGIFGESYGGATETQYALDLQRMPDYIRGGTVPDQITQANFNPVRLLTLKTRASAAYKGIYALQMKSGARDWRTDNSLVRDKQRNKDIDIHHIFPKKWCKVPSRKIPEELWNSIINKTPIDASTNRTIGGNAPSKYIEKLCAGDNKSIDPDLLDAVLRSHWINPEFLKADNFARSFVERGEAMLKQIGDAMGKPADDGKAVFEEALTEAGFARFVDEYDTSDEVEYDDIGEAAD